MQRTPDSGTAGLMDKEARKAREMLQASHRVTSKYKDLEKTERFTTCRSTHRFLAAYHKNLILVDYLEPKGRPQEFARLVCAKVGADMEGLFSAWYVVYHPRTMGLPLAPHQRIVANHITIRHTPLEVAPGVFIWHMVESVVTYDSALQISMLSRSSHNPLKFRIPGQAYLMEEGQFYQMQGE